MIGFIVLLVLLYLCVALGFRWGKTVGAGAERHSYRIQAGRNGGYIFIPGAGVDAAGNGVRDGQSEW